MSVALKAGFDEPVRDSQQAFRRILDAMSQPGRIVMTPSPVEMPDGLHPAAAAACLTLLDFETRLWLAGDNAAEVRAWLAFHAGCRFAAAPAEADFALVLDPAHLPTLTDFPLGSDEQPETGATLVVQTRGLASGRGFRLSGPGVLGRRQFSVEGLPQSFWRERAALCEQFPRGLDILFTTGMSLAALPRTTKAEG
jgi:alpha-D-ribose 1-methylphosphonate 5-triphosphate synthase subunit PhnH